jgi:SPP1 family predicted phage head-tail adaptor
MRAGLLNKPIIINKPVVVKDEFGGEVETYVNHISTRANVTFNSGNRKMEASEIVTDCTVTFTVRHYHRINETMQIVYDGRKYRILSINRERQKTVIISELINE